MVEGGGIVSLKQPIVSLKEKRVIGYEALSRGLDLSSGDLIPPDRLFKAAEAFGMTLDVDRACRLKAIEEYARCQRVGDPLLFVNFDPTILNRVSIGSGWMKDQVKRHGISPSSVAIEIVEARVQSQEDLELFVSFYREAGFLIVLDDFGSEHSNLNRVLQVKPDIIKIDRTLVENIGTDFYKRAIVETIIHLASKIGALSLVEGVENLEDIQVCHELGADLYQGFYFSKPRADLFPLPDICRRRMGSLFQSIEYRQAERLAEDRAFQKKFTSLIGAICNILSRNKQETFDIIMENLSGLHDRVECLYILDAIGCQVSRTHCHPNGTGNSRNPLFRPSEKGADHSLKSYFFFMQGMTRTEHYSDPYISLATGNLCRTLSRLFVTSNGDYFIFCADFSVRKPDALKGRGPCRLRSPLEGRDAS
ncbi:histidine kinase [Desulfoluna limicola]|uniref:Histidine kinase n=2 Tax=Desulfoluna limicola TaxID=2810562 RepID=A0ABN6FAJ2_9BACT|nr:histidine kinase [Desulfoluna limicola]